MASNARKAFSENMRDINALVDLFETIQAMEKEDPTNPFPDEYDVVLRSAVVLLVTYWEAYIEDIVAEAVAHLVANVSSPDDLPKELRKELAASLKQDKNDLAVWKLAENGWRTELNARLNESAKSRNRNFNTPKSLQTKEFVRATLGIDDISKSWTLNGKTAEDARKMLDVLVEVRGQIAHRGKLSKKLEPANISQFRQFFEQLIAKTGGAINSHLKKHAKQGLW